MKAGKLKLALLALAITLVGGGAYALGHHQGEDHVTAPIQPLTPVSTPAGAAGNVLPDLGSIVERYGPAVVNISVSGSSKAVGRQMPPEIDPDDPFYEFFRHFRIPQPQGPLVRGLGSGFIFTPDGFILTNAHVIDGADEVTVKLTDKREFQAKVRGLDKASDVAVLKIDAKDLPTVKIGSASSTRVGEWVLAIGSPFGFENSASAGIVSAKSRSLPDGSYVPFIQTDVAVNPGNSGGPLFNMVGEVIGINSQIYSRSGGYQGVSFAIPIELAMNVEKQIVTNGKVQRGRLGIAIQEVNQALADSFGLPRPAGALVSSVEKGSPADQAGLQAGDVILKINGQEIHGSGELPAVVAGMAAGEIARLQVWRNGAPRDFLVKVGTFNDANVAVNEEPEKAKTRIGVAVRPLSPEERRQADVPGGVLVQEAAGAAARAGIRPGDIILSVNGETVSSPEQLRNLVAKGGKRVAILIQRGEMRLFVPAEIG